ncbi:MAG: caspase family protein, partial [Moorea sp. SIO2B7]|nr:caspase family protein [Moorena sp. SIO2B7]
MGFDRRTFLKQAGLSLLTLGLSETGLLTLDNLPWLKRYYQTLAQPTSRKLALLVGINKYPQNTNLNGCLTDIELQKELLIHRFGFNPRDILILRDQQATREDIETAFVEHLMGQVTAGDIVVFHFSGYGNQVNIPQSVEDESEPEQPRFRLMNSLVPVDGILPTGRLPAANDLLEETLFLLGRSLATDKLTMVLDTSYILYIRFGNPVLSFLVNLGNSSNDSGNNHNSFKL